MKGVFSCLISVLGFVVVVLSLFKLFSSISLFVVDEFFDFNDLICESHVHSANSLNV